MTPYVFLNNLIRYSFLLVFLSILGLALWGIDKGFDITDEGYYILGYQKGQEIGSDIRNFHIIIKKLFFWIELDIINIRLIRLILTLSSSAVFVFALIKFIKNKVDYIFLFSAIAISNLLSYGFGPQSLSYNTLTANFIIFSLSFMILGIAEPNKHITRKHIIYNMLTGTFLALTFFVKPPAGILASVCLLFYFLINYRAPIKIKSISLLLTSTGFLTGLLFYFIFCQSFYDFYSAIILNIDILTKGDSGHDTSSLINGFNTLLYKVFEISGILSLFLIIFFFLKQKINKSNRPPLLYLTYAILGICFLLYYNSYLITGPWRNAFPYLILTLIFILYLFFYNVIKQEAISFNIKIISNVILLLILPVVGAFGTNNALISNCMYMLSCWIALITIIMYDFKLDLKFKVFFLYLFLFTSVYLFYNHYVSLPYRIAPLTEQKKEIASKRIKLDERTANCVETIREILIKNNFKPGDPIIGLYKIPGLIYLLNGISPGSALHPWDDLHYFGLIENLKRSKEDFKESYFLIKNPYNDSLITKLNTLGVNFPQDYYYVGGVQIPGSSAIRGFCKIYSHKNKINSELITANKLSQQAFSLLNEQKYFKSISLYLKILAIIPNNTSALNNLGYAYMQISDFNNAAIAFKKAIDIEPGFNLARNNLNWARSELKKSKQ